MFTILLLASFGSAGEPVAEPAAPTHPVGPPPTPPLETGAPPADVPAATAGAAPTLPNDPVVLGSLDRQDIDTEIKRNLSDVRGCYQRELGRNPGLAGKVIVKFVIATDGSVSSAETKSSTLGSPAVEACVNSKFMKFAFPKPKGGGVVIVSYPFVFNSGGGL